jgi:hypothetical protein
LTALQFAAAWAPAGVAGAAVAARHGSPPSSLANVVLMWLFAGALALPAAQTFGVLVPLDDLLRGAESEFGVGVYMTVAMVIAGLGVADFPCSHHTPPDARDGVGILDHHAFRSGHRRVQHSRGDCGFRRHRECPQLLASGLRLGDRGRRLVVAAVVGVRRSGADQPAGRDIPDRHHRNGARLWRRPPVAFYASTLTSSRTGPYLADKGFMNVTRTIPDLFWA